MAYYSSETCGYLNGNYAFDGCTADYSQSEVKYVVDAWKSAQAPLASEARLIIKEEIEDNFEFEEYEISCGGCGAKENRIITNWMYNSKYCYWTSSSEDSDTLLFVWYVNTTGTLLFNYYINGMSNNQCAVRPVIVLPKSALN